MNGFLLVNKPVNCTSFDVIAKLRKIFGIKRIGHAGTLDPLASGLMLVGVGKATRFLEFHVGHDKTYKAEVTLGKFSETYDSEGPLTDTSFTGNITLDEIQKALECFRGEIEQIPPKYSALKIGGEKYCNLVRAGKQVDISAKKRTIHVFVLDILAFDWPVLTLNIHCSSGTYIRSIAHDLGEKLGCGGYLSHLVRTKIHEFSLENAKELNDVSQKDIQPLDVGLNFVKLHLEEEHIQKLKFGQKVFVNKSVTQNDTDLVSVYLNNVFEGIAKHQNGLLLPKKMLV